MKRMMFPAFAAALFVAPSLAAAQAPAPQAPPPQSEPPAAAAPAQPAPKAEAKATVARGELVKVDADGKKITVKGADGVETEFAYNDATEIAGGRDGAAGLATKSGSKVVVQYTSDKGVKTATKIEIQGGAGAEK
jgi:hypothetical protein